MKYAKGKAAYCRSRHFEPHLLSLENLESAFKIILKSFQVSGFYASILFSLRQRKKEFKLQTMNDSLEMLENFLKVLLISYGKKYKMYGKA